MIGTAAVTTAMAFPVVAATPAIHKVGAVTRHAASFVGQDVVLRGYVLAREPGYILFSDESRGAISRYDLPVVGDGADQMALKTKYLIEGKFVDGGLTTVNSSRYHLELSKPPTAVDNSAGSPGQ